MDMNDLPTNLCKSLEQEEGKIFQGDCTKLLKHFPDDSVDLICTDPPYFKIKKGKNIDSWWDNQWNKPKEFISWLDGLILEWQRILKKNGSLYCFASPKMSAHVELAIGRRFNVLNNIIWVKPDGSGAEKGARGGLTNRYIHQSERIIFCENKVFCDQIGTNIFSTPMSLYISSLRKSAKLSCTELTEAVRGKKTGLCWLWENPFTAGGCVPSWNDFVKIHAVCQRENKPQMLTNEELRQKYDSLCRPFYVSEDVNYTDVWTFPVVRAYSGKHICEKPVSMLEHIINVSSRPGDIVLDCFAGSGSTLIAAKNLHRKYIGIEIDPYWVNRCKQRLGDFEIQPLNYNYRLNCLDTEISLKAQQSKKNANQIDQLSLIGIG